MGQLVLLLHMLMLKPILCWFITLFETLVQQPYSTLVLFPNALYKLHVQRWFPSSFASLDQCSHVNCTDTWVQLPSTTVYSI